MQQNKIFDQDTYDRCDAIGKAKVMEYFRYQGNDFVCYEAPEEDKYRHFDLIAKIPWDNGVQPITIEVEARENHYDNVYHGVYVLHVPKRKLFLHCDSANEQPDVPDMLVVVSSDPNDRRFIVLFKDDIVSCLGNIELMPPNRTTHREELFVWFPKEVCHRWKIEGNKLVYDGTVADG